MKIKYRIEGMNCTMCVKAIEDSLKELPGIITIDINLLSGLLICEFDKPMTNEQIIETIRKEGFGIRLIKQNDQRNSIIPFQNYRKRLLISIILFIPLFIHHLFMLFNYSIPFLVNHSILSIIIQASLGITIAFVNYQYYIKGIKAIFKRHPSMDTLIALSTFCAYAYSIYQVINVLVTKQSMNDITLHFETGSMILVFVTIGKYLENRAKHLAVTSIEKMIESMPKVVTLINDEVKPIEEILIGDIVIVKAMEKIPLDGIVIRGTSFVNQAVITGEALPVQKQSGDFVIGGTMNGSGSLEIKVTKTSNEGVFQQIIDLMDETSASKAPMARLADRISKFFVPIILLIATITFIIWLIISHDVNLAMMFAMAVMVISCPCALGLATPTSILIGTKRAADNGIMIRNAEVLEILSQVRVIIFDKTNTITSGELVLQRLTLLKDVSQNEIISIVKALEKHSTHPIAKAISQITIPELISYSLQQFHEIPGRGVEAFIENDIFFFGNHSNYNDHQIRLLKNNEPLAIFTFSDEIKESSINAINKLRNKGYQVIILTGDSHENAEMSLKKVTFDEIITDVMPIDKEKIVEKYQNLHRQVMMVGDGVNDSVAILKADVGVAVGNGSDIAIESADIVLMNNNLDTINILFNLGHKVHQNIRQNLFWALFYNMICIPLAAGVFYGITNWQLTPGISAIAMSISSLFVVTNALRLRKIKLGDKNDQSRKYDV